MTTIDLGTTKFGSEYPLPGGVENYFDTLLALLRFVRDHDVTSDGLADWFNITTGATAQVAVRQAIKIGGALKQCSTAGGDGKEFEEATAAAFAFLGFETQLISGSGNPDVLATAPMGEKSYRVLIDSKSRTSGTVQQNDLPYPALQKQKKNANADYIVVVGPGFAGGQLAEFAQQLKIRLITADELRDLLLAHAKSAFPLDLLKPLFEGGGLLDEGVLSTVQSSAESSGEMMELAGKVFIAINEHQGKAGAINCDSLFYILHGAHEIPVIKMVIDFLKCDLIGALGQASNGSLHTRLSPQSLEQKLAQVADSLSLGKTTSSFK